MVITAKFPGRCAYCCVGYYAERLRRSAGSVASAARHEGRQRAAARRRGWDGVEGSASAYTSGRYDDM